MGFLDKLTAFLPFNKKEEIIEYFFALNIGAERLTAALWSIENKELKILETATDTYSARSEIIHKTDRLLDAVLGIRQIEPQKILFGVPNSWLSDDDLKEEDLKLLRDLVKELELSPLAYVSASNAIIHLLEKKEGVPTTAILVGFETHHITVTVVRAGKMDGVKIIARGDSSGTDIEKALLTYSSVETLPSRMLIFGLDQSDLNKLKNQLLSFPWMSNLSFLHLPKIDVLGEEIEIKSVCLAGATELDSTVVYQEAPIKQVEAKSKIPETEDETDKDIKEEEATEEKDFGFIVGDVSEKTKADEEVSKERIPEEKTEEENPKEVVLPEQSNLLEVPASQPSEKQKKLNLKFLRRFITLNPVNLMLALGLAGILGLILGATLFLPKAEIKIFVEPKILEKDTQVIADPAKKEVDEAGKIIPGQIVETEVSGSSKESATGKKQIGENAKGTVVLRNKTDGLISLSKGTSLTASNGLKFSLDLAVNIASRSAEDGTWGKQTATVTASAVGADGNLPSGTDFTILGQTTDRAVAKAEGNFSGGTSKDVTVVSDADQKKLLASLASNLRRQAQQKLQEKLPDKKILEEALSEEIIRKSYSKNINDQALEFSLNLTAKYKGTAFEEKDLRLIVSKMVDTQIPQGFELNLSETETQADVSKLEKDGRLIFLARFKAKLMPKIDSEEIKKKIRGKSLTEVSAELKQMENVLGSEITIRPKLPAPLQRIPLLTRNIKIEVGLK